EPGRMAIALRPLLPQRLLAWFAGPAFDRDLGPFDMVINLFYAWEKGMDFRAYWTPQVPSVPGATHSLDFLADEIERQLDIIITHEQRKPRLIVRPSPALYASRFWLEHELGGQKVVALVPSTNMAIKRWTLDGWLKLDAHLRALGHRTLLFCGGESNSLQRAFQAAGSTAIPVHTSLENVAGVLSHCDLAVGVDTGLLHMAGALDVPWVGLFGPTNPEVTGPYDRSKGISLVAPFEKQASCGGCWKHFKYEDDTCRTLREGSCMSYLQEPEVLAACLEVLKRERATSPVYLPAYGYPMPVGAYAPGFERVSA
ncbi:MAG TPA: glycosyltransferase family 9 protein, partial [Chloroflexia bacterium]|nr:glycosyltransferase family 9 protein [Chloroflexia bacterium]